MTSEQHGNVDAKKKNTRFIGIGVIVIFTFFVVGMVAMTILNIKRLSPSSPGMSISDFAREKPAPQAIVPFEKNDRTYFGWIAELPSWDVPSGPPIYVFDESGKMIDFTIDVGDDPSFKDNWEPLMTRSYDKENYISLEEVEARIAKALTPAE